MQRATPAILRAVEQVQDRAARSAKGRRQEETNANTTMALAGAGSNWPPEWPPEPVRDVRIISLNLSPVTESNRRPSPYHGDALPTELTGPIFT